MRLISESQITALEDRIGAGQGLRTAEIAVDVDPFDFARTGAALVDRAVAFSGPDGFRLAGLGTAWRAEASGPRRFVDLKHRIAELGDNTVKGFLGFSFLPGGDTPRQETSIWDGYAPAEMFVPRIAIEGVEGGSLVRIAVPEHEDPRATLDLLASMRHPEWQAVVDLGGHATKSNPPVSQWVTSVEQALELIDSHAIDKVVLARSVIVRSETPPAILRMFRALVASYPQCYNFAWKSGDAVFMGASPELLASVSNGHMQSNPLAGSAPRGEGSASDDAIGVALLHSKKDLHEHALVVDDMVRTLAPLVADVTRSVHPSLKKMASVQHLSTHISGGLADGAGLLDVIGAVHPTPAVGGSPTHDAVSVIGRLEAIDRGWYTGGVGWVNGAGDGSVALALRCGLVRGLTTHLFAGAGIVAGSVADDELNETRLKLEPLLRLLTVT